METIKLNLGGRVFVTTRQTLCQGFSPPDSLLARAFSTENAGIVKKDEEGCYFFDRDGDDFVPILHYLRTGTIDAERYWSSSAMRAEFNFWGIDVKVEKPIVKKSISETLYELSAGITTLDDIPSNSIRISVCNILDAMFTNWETILSYNAQSEGFTSANICMLKFNIIDKFTSRYSSISSMMRKQMASAIKRSNYYPNIVKDMVVDNVKTPEYYVDKARIFLNLFTSNSFSTPTLVYNYEELGNYLYEVCKNQATFEDFLMERINDPVTDPVHRQNLNQGLLYWYAGEIKQNSDINQLFPNPRSLSKTERGRQTISDELARRGFQSTWQQGMIKVIREDYHDFKYIETKSTTAGITRHTAMTFGGNVERKYESTQDLIDPYFLVSDLPIIKKPIWLCTISWDKKNIKPTIDVPSRKRQREDE